MLNKLIFTCAALAVLSSSAFAAVIASWDFESSTPADATDFADYPNAIPPTTGTGNADGVHAGAATDWTTPAGNGSANSFSSNTWAIGDYYQFAASTAGFASGIYVSFSQTSSNTGPRDFQLEYSTTGPGGPFTLAGAYMVPANAAPNAWSSTTPVPAAFFSFDLTSVGALSDNANAVFRLTDTSTTSANGGTVAAAGTSRVDDFTVSDTPIAPPIPEPAVLLAVLSGAGVLLARRKRFS